MTTHLTLPIYGIVISMNEDGAVISSDLSLEGQFGLAKIYLFLLEDRRVADAQLKVIERMIRAHALFGVDLTAKSYQIGIKVAVEEILAPFRR